MLKWILVAGVVVSGGKIVYDMMKAPPAITDTPATESSSASASASASSDVDSIIPRHPPTGTQPTNTAPPSDTTTAPTDSASAAPSGSSSAAPAGSLPAMLWAIAQDPKGNKPVVAQRDPQTGLFVFVYEALPGVDQPVLLVVPGEVGAWAWQLESDLSVEKLTGATKLEKLPPPRPGVTAVKIVGGPFDQSVAVLPAERPKLRLVKSPGFVKLEAEEMKKAGAGGGGPGGPGGGPGGGGAGAPPGTGH
jgi:hypothetical protein